MISPEKINTCNIIRTTGCFYIFRNTHTRSVLRTIQKRPSVWKKGRGLHLEGGKGRGEVKNISSFSMAFLEDVRWNVIVSTGSFSFVFSHLVIGRASCPALHGACIPAQSSPCTTKPSPPAPSPPSPHWRPLISRYGKCLWFHWGAVNVLVFSWDMASQSESVLQLFYNSVFVTLYKVTARYVSWHEIKVLNNFIQSNC